MGPRLTAQASLKCDPVARHRGILRVQFDADEVSAELPGNNASRARAREWVKDDAAARVVTMSARRLPSDGAHRSEIRPAATRVVQPLRIMRLRVGVCTRASIGETSP
jgi:hypothetical protein